MSRGQSRAAKDRCAGYTLGSPDLNGLLSQSLGKVFHKANRLFAAATRIYFEYLRKKLDRIYKLH